MGLIQRMRMKLGQALDEELNIQIEGEAFELLHQANTVLNMFHRTASHSREMDVDNSHADLGGEVDYDMNALDADSMDSDDDSAREWEFNTDYSLDDDDFRFPNRSARVQHRTVSVTHEDL